MVLDLESIQLEPGHFEHISRLVHRLAGIHLRPGKESLVTTRLIGRLRALGLASFDEYLTYLSRDGSGRELARMVDALTTNKTSFFREHQHFDFLCTQVLPELVAGNRRIRMWSAGCSSGEEPYSIAMLLRQEVPGIDRRDARILATDISARMLERAREAVYDQENLAGIPPGLVQRFFTRVRSSRRPAYRVNDEVRALVRLARLNLMDSWPMKGPFDVIFCRNVMIYFDHSTQQQLARRLCDLLRPGGYLFIGHSESLVASATGLRYVQPAVFVR